MSNSVDWLPRPSLVDVKVGDLVYVAWQGRGGRANGYVEVTKVGREYAYFSLDLSNYRFHRENGLSADERDSNARANGWGFDVYLTELDYTNLMHYQSQAKRLKERLVDGWGKIKNLPPAVVDRMHELLDESEVD